MGGTRLGFRHRDRTIGDGTPLIRSARIPYDVPENLNAVQYDFTRDNYLARCRIPVGRRQRQASGTRFSDRQLCATVAVDLLGPPDREVQGISVSFS